jgi:hypothetical protein
MPDLKMSLIRGGKNEGVAMPSFPLVERGLEELITDLEPMQEAVDLPDLFAGLARSVLGSLKADVCLLSVLDDDGAFLRDVAASVTPPATYHSLAERYRLDDFPATRDVIRSGRPLETSVSDPRADPSERRFAAKMGFGRMLLCRFTLEGRPIGTVEAMRTEDRPFRADDGRQVDILCKFAANAYQRIQLSSKLELHYTETIEALVSALEARDPYTQAHAGRIRDTAVALATAMKIPGDIRRAVRLGSILHDVGKIGISDAILSKPGPLSDDEWVAMRAHPAIGERMLSGIDFLGPSLPIIRHHHERWDGRGYPDGLVEEAIPIGARIVAVCDALDAMTTDRPYRRAMSLQRACDELVKESGKQFDPQCVSLLVDVVSSAGAEPLEDLFVRYAS